MKKVICFMLAALLLLSSCSATKTKTKWPMSEQHEKYGRKALEIVDEYLDYDASMKETYKKLNELTKTEGTLPEDANKEEEHGNFMIEIEVSNLEGGFLLAMTNGDTSKIVEMRNSLAESLGEKAR